MSAPEQAAQIPSGVYYIVVASPGHFQNQRLTDGINVTVAPPNVEEEPKQKWGVQMLENGNILIKRPSDIRPALLLSYGEGEGGPPMRGEKIVLHREGFPNPTEWHAGIAPGFRFSLRVAGSELGIGVGKEMLPPFLNLAFEDQFVWMFERVAE